MTLQHLRLILMSGLVLGLGGCQFFPRLNHLVKMTPVPADASLRPAGKAGDEFYARAVAAIDQRDYGLALDVLQLARQRRADDPRVLTAMAVVYDKLGRFDLSKRYYDLAEAADPGSKVVSIDRAYSVVLQQHAAQPAVVLAASSNPYPRAVAASVALPPEAASPPEPRGIALLGHGVRIVNATGGVGVAEAIQTRLASQGWSLIRAPNGTGNAVRVSRLSYPPSAETVANGLSHSLSFPVNLDSCASCTSVELVIGTDALSFPEPRPSKKVKRG